MQYLRYSLIYLLVSGILCGGAAWAADAKVEKFAFGDITVWAIADAVSERDLAVFPGVTPEIARQYVPDGKTPSSIMTFLIQMDQELILVDTGLGKIDGGLLPGLAAAGFKPEDVTLVLLTHCHGDHVGGLASEGQRAFPNATVFLSNAEYDYWMSDDAMAASPNRKGNFELVREMFALYPDDVTSVAFGETLGKRITFEEAVGHTPGHTAFVLRTDDGSLLIAGDFLHAAALQFPRPDINATYDMDPAQAAASRKKLLAMAATNNWSIAGMHLPFPGIGQVDKIGDGSYKFAPGLN